MEHPESWHETTSRLSAQDLGPDFAEKRSLHEAQTSWAESSSTRTASQYCKLVQNALSGLCINLHTFRFAFLHVFTQASLSDSLAQPSGAASDHQLHHSLVCYRKAEDCRQAKHRCSIARCLSFIRLRIPYLQIKKHGYAMTLSTCSNFNLHLIKSSNTLFFLLTQHNSSQSRYCVLFLIQSQCPYASCHRFLSCRTSSQSAEESSSPFLQNGANDSVHSFELSLYSSLPLSTFGIRSYMRLS